MLFSIATRKSCTACKKRFNERTGTPMFRLRTPQAVVETDLKARSEGLGVQATARVLDKSHNSIRTGESRLALQESKWSPNPSAETTLTLEGDELYTKVEKNRAAHETLG